MKLRLLAVFIISTLLISCNHQSNEHRLDNTNVLSIPQNSTEEILNESNDSCLSPTNKQTNDDNSSFGINVFGDEGPIGYLLADGKDITEVMLGMLEKIKDDSTEVISIYYGSDVTEADAEAMKEKVVEKYPDIDVEVAEGGQPVYYYIVSAE